MVFFYNTLNKKKQDKLQSMLIRFLRIVYNDENMGTDDMHMRLGIGKLRPRRDMHLCGLTYRRSQCEEYLDVRELPTRQFDKIVLKVPNVILTKSFNTPLYKGANMWNRLPKNVHISPTYKEFKYRY